MRTNPSAPLLSRHDILFGILQTDPETAIRDILILLDQAIDRLQRSQGSDSPSTHSQPSSLVPGGVILITDDGRGIARAVAADLRALGHPVVRVEHGVGSAGIQGVNLSSATSVSAMVERTRQFGPLTAIVHLSPLRVEALDGDSVHSTDDEHRKLKLLLSASAEELIRSANSGGACFIAARSTYRWIEALPAALKQVRFRDLKLDMGSDIEVLAAIVVQEVLESRLRDVTRSERVHREARIRQAHKVIPCEAILLGAPDRVRWLELAEALAISISRTPELGLTDLAETLHVGQPAYPFRVGLVAYSVSDLGHKLDLAIESIQDAECHHIHDREGIYWTESGWEREAIKSSGSLGKRETTYLQRRISSWILEGKTNPHTVSIPFPSTQEWLHHETASRFGHGEPVKIDFLSMGRRAKKLDLRTLNVETLPSVPGQGPEIARVALFYEVMRLMDKVLEHEKRLALELLRA